MKEKQKQNAAMPLRPVLRCFGAILELLVTLALLTPSICTVLLPEKGFFSLRFLKWEAGVCFAAAILILSLVCPLVKVEFEPSGLVTTGKLLLRIGAVSWLLHASIVLGGASVAAFGLFWEIPLVKWIFFPLGVLISSCGVYLGIADRRQTERIRRGDYVIELTELTDCEHVEEDHPDRGGDGAATISHEYYMSFDKSKMAKTKKLRVDFADYSGYPGDAYYLVIQDGDILCFFPAAGRTLDEEVQRHLVKDAGEE